MTNAIQLPDDVMASLAGAVESVRAQVVQATQDCLYPVILRKAKTVVRANEGRDSGHDRGAALVLDAAFPGREPVNSVMRRDGDLGVTVPGSADDDDDDADDESCDEWSSCCGWCSDHQQHCGDEADDNVCSMGHCHECDHYCANY